jgi:hypothetical protein
MLRVKEFSLEIRIRIMNFNITPKQIPTKNPVFFPPIVCAIVAASFIFLLTQTTAQAGPREQAKRIHERLAGVAPSESVLSTMTSQINAGDGIDATLLAMENPQYYNVTLKNFITPWTNETASSYAPLNDYTATVIGMIRDDMDFREILSADILYIADSALGLPSYSNSNNNLYQALEDESIDLKANLIQVAQSSVTGLPAAATAGVTTTRAAAKSFFIDGTNRAMFRFTLINQLCTDLEPLKDITRSPDRIRQDVSRSPGGDSRIFLNNCIGCHTGMDPLAQAYAYYEFSHDVDNDPDGDAGSLTYNDTGDIDADTGSRVQKKYQINANNFKFGFITENDNWDNYWRAGQNANLGWSNALTGSGQGAKSMGEELSNSEAFASCQVKKVFKQVCLRSAVDATDRNQIDSMVTSFKSNSYNIKQVFSESALYCMGD